MRNIFVIILGLFMAVSANAAVNKNVRPRAKKQQVVMAEKSVNINSADVLLMQKVKGIGPKKAAAIIAYRNAKGPFKSIEDITKVKGIGQKKLAKFAKYLTV